ncbi:MAG: ABC transporter permease [Clostridiales bacterium]|nr:ABC transporter permease [Clostridiales bacterium]
MKKRHMLVKDFFREVKSSRNRFLSIMVIIVLGVAFFSGIRATSPDMELSADTYYDRAKLMDIRILSTLGLTDSDLKELEQIEGVGSVSPSYSRDVLCRLENSQPVIHLMALTPGLNQVTVTEGRLPEKKNEIFMDEEFMKNYGYHVGDTIQVFSGEDDTDIEDMVSESEYTITGMGNSPFYLSIDRGTSSIGDGDVSGFGVIPMDSFSMEAYTEIYLSVDGADQEICYGDEYEEIVDQVKDRLEGMADEQCQVRFATVKGDGQEDIDAAKQEIADAKKKLSDAEKELADGEKQLADGKKELQDKEEELQEGKSKLEEESQKLQDGKSQLASGRQELDSQAAVLNQKKEELAAGKNQLAGKEEELQEGIARLEDGENQLLDGEKEIEAGEQELQAGEKELEAAKHQLTESRKLLESQASLMELAKEQLPGLKELMAQAESGLQLGEEQLAVLNQELAQLQAEYEEALNAPVQDEEKIKALEAKIEMKKSAIAVLEKSIEALREKKTEIDAGIAELEKVIQAYDDGLQKITEGEKLLAEKEEELKQGKEKLQQARAELEGKKAELAAAKAELAAGQQQLDAAKAELASGESQLAAGEQQLSDARGLLESEAGKLTAGEKELAKAKKELKDGEKQITDAKETLKEKEEELSEGKEEFEKESKDAEEEIREAEEKITDAQKELDKLEVPTWYVLGRDSLQTYVEYGQDSQRIEAIGKVFPAIFFLVAALICLTTMTRMVEENRTQIGTLKALGYGKGAIAGKYLFYAFLASFIGSVIGVAAGQKTLPVIIIQAYSILYNNLPETLAPLYAGYTVSSTLLAVGITVLAAGIACYRELAAVPAELMRPEAPKNGKRILLERMPFIWKHLSFSNKATARNLFRYKKRFFMTVLGIGGCMGLLMVGFGLRDSIMAIGEKQFGEIRTYSSAITLEMDSSEEERAAVLEMVQKDQDIKTSMLAYESSVDVGFGEQEKSSYLVVASDLEKFKDFVTLKDRKTKKVYELDHEGVVITEKLAKLLEIDTGDTIYLKDGDTKRIEVKVSHIVENYFFHYVYMAPEVYEKLYEEPPEYSEIMTVNTEDTEEFEKEFQNRYMAVDGVLNVSFLSSVSGRIADMLRSMDSVIYIIVIAAGMLAFVVLYNLNNINISERRRELATLKVLGFYELEVSQYVFRENVVLTLIGSLTGVVFGLILHRFVILTAEIDIMMFGRNIKFMSFFYSICLTFLFSSLVNLFMHFKLRKLDMVESMKSVE